MSPLKFSVDTQLEMRKCHIFVAITNKVRSNNDSNKMKNFYNKSSFLHFYFSFISQDWRTTLTSNVPVRII